ncbi:MAG: hypothetical protein WCA77_08645, partial [Thermoplasmata archaeon]
MIRWDFRPMLRPHRPQGWMAIVAMIITAVVVSSAALGGASGSVRTSPVPSRLALPSPEWANASSATRHGYVGEPMDCAPQIGPSCASALQPAAIVPGEPISWINLTGVSGLAPATSSGAGRYDAGMAFDPASQQYILFGGCAPSCATPAGDTWAYHYTQWVNETPGTLNGTDTPSPRFGPLMLDDPAMNAIVLYGGASGLYTTEGQAPTGLSDVWLFSGRNWSPCNSCDPTAPPGRWDAAAAYDPSNGAILLFGGATSELGGVEPLGDTWVFVNGVWSQVRFGGQPLCGGVGQG